MLSKLLIRFFIALSVVQFGLFIFSFIATRESQPVIHVVLGMGIGLYLLWILLFGLVTLAAKDTVRSFVSRIRLNWALTFIFFCTALALLEEVVTVGMTNTAPLYGLQIGQAYITASANYLDVVLGHSVIAFIPLFIGWAWLLSRYDFSPEEVFLLFGVTGTIIESISGGAGHLLEIGMWMFVYGLMVYLPAYSLPVRKVLPVKWYHALSAVFTPILFCVILIPILPVVHYLRPSTLISFPPLSTSADTVQFGGVSLRLDYALTEVERERGLGGRTSVPDDYGMLFVFPKDGYYGFWMKDTLVPLDMFWLDNKGQVVSIATDVLPSSYPSVFYPSVPARYVLETAAGFATTHQIATGTPLQLKNFPNVLQ